MGNAFAFTPPPVKGECPDAPLKDDGDVWEWGIRLPNGDMGWADDIPTLVAMLVGNISEYLSADDQQRCVLRIRAAIRIQCWKQAELNTIAQCILAHWDELAEWERAILNGRRDRQPSGFPTREMYDGQDVWGAPVPLVVVRTGYSPYGSVEPIVGVDGMVWEIDPATDKDLLTSLSGAPFFMIDLWEKDHGW